MRRRVGIAAGLTGLALGLAGCGGPGGGAPGTDAVAGQVTVFAAASLSGAFDEIAADVEAAHPGVEIEPIRYDGSSTLATQLIEGARADVFASADEANLQRVVDAGLAASPRVFATNRLTLVVPTGNPGDVSGLADLAEPDLAVVLCAAEVPCGAASGQLAQAAGVTPRVDSYEQNVTAVLTKIATGEADAGLVYVTDAAGSDDVETVPTVGADDVVNRYPIVALAEARTPAAAAFVDHVLSPAGRAVLERWGFGAP